jgi:hypothetical protein
MSKLGRLLKGMAARGGDGGAAMWCPRQMMAMLTELTILRMIINHHK